MVPLPPGADALMLWGMMKVAVAVASAETVMVQAVEVPVQAPVQPVKRLPASAMAVRTTLEP